MSSHAAGHLKRREDEKGFILNHPFSSGENILARICGHFSGSILLFFRHLTDQFFLAHFFSGEFLMFRLLFNLRLAGYA